MCVLTCVSVYVSRGGGRQGLACLPCTPPNFSCWCQCALLLLGYRDEGHSFSLYRQQRLLCGVLSPAALPPCSLQLRTQCVSASPANIAGEPAWPLLSVAALPRCHSITSKPPTPPAWPLAASPKHCWPHMQASEAAAALARRAQPSFSAAPQALRMCMHTTCTHVCAHSGTCMHIHVHVLTCAASYTQRTHTGTRT